MNVVGRRGITGEEEVSKYIDADTLIKGLHGRLFITHFNDENWFEKIMNQVIDEIKNTPAADVEEVRHGRWEMKEDPYGFFDTIPVCSACGCTTKYRVTSAHCPNCGAKMDEVEE